MKFKAHEDNQTTIGWFGGNCSSTWVSYSKHMSSHYASHFFRELDDFEQSIQRGVEVVWISMAAEQNHEGIIATSEVRDTPYLAWFSSDAAIHR